MNVNEFLGMTESEQIKIEEKYFLPARIMAHDNVKNEKVLLEKQPRQSGFKNHLTGCKICSGGYILLDFGKEIAGGIYIAVFKAEGAKLHIRFGESVSEAMTELGEKNSTNNHSMRDYTIDVPDLSEFRTGDTGFRFVYISSDKDIYIRTIQAVLRYRPAEYHGKFHSNDERINKIWETAAYTVHLNMQEYIWEGVKRDRLVWSGDMHPEISTIINVFGDSEIVKKSLDYVLNDSEDWIGLFPSYSMWWIIMHYDLYMHFGELRYLNENKTDILRTVKRFCTELAKDNDCCKFMDWSSHETKGEESGFYSLLLRALRTGEELAVILGDEALAKECKASVLKVIDRSFDFGDNKQMVALGYLGGAIEEQDAYDMITKNGAEGFSTFMGYYNLCSLGEMNKIETALDIMKEYWGGMLDMGATTFWEEFDVGWMKDSVPIDGFVPQGKKDIHADFGKDCYVGLRKSLCHGWASGPAAFLIKYVLGVKILEPGCKKISIKGNLGNLEFAEGSFPTPYGDIYIQHKNENGKIVSQIKAPPEIQIV